MINSNFNFKKNYVHLIVQIRSKANDVIKIVWTLSGFNISAIAGRWRPPEASVRPLAQRYLRPFELRKSSWQSDPGSRQAAQLSLRFIFLRIYFLFVKHIFKNLFIKIDFIDINY